MTHEDITAAINDLLLNQVLLARVEQIESRTASLSDPLPVADCNHPPGIALIAGSCPRSLHLG